MKLSHSYAYLDRYVLRVLILHYYRNDQGKQQNGGGPSGALFILDNKMLAIGTLKSIYWPRKRDCESASRRQLTAFNPNAQEYEHRFSFIRVVRQEARRDFRWCV